MCGHNKRELACRSRPLLVVPLLCWFIFTLPVRAQNQTISQMIHTVWTGRDGAPPGIRALAQTPDGIMWIASLKGLYTFDGLSFAPFRPNPGSPDIPPMTLRDLLVAKSGDLWVGGYHGPAVRIHNGKVTVCKVAAAEANDSLDYLQQDATGAVWAVANDRELVRLGADDIWHPMPGPIPEPGHIELLSIDSMGTQWVIENDTLYRKARGDQQFLATGVPAHFLPTLKEGADHTIWILAPVSGTTPGQMRVSQIQQVDQSGRRVTGPMNVGDPIDILPGTDGSLWIMTGNDELLHLRSQQITPGNSEQKSGITDSVKLGGGEAAFHAVMLDASGAVWVGGLDGLERFAHATLVPAIPGAPAGFWYSCVVPSGDIFVSHYPADFYRIRDGRLTRVDAVKESGNPFCGPDGTVYMEGNGIVTVRENKVGHLPLLPGFPG
jgi:ligand-binding sensor domain-containing protein